mgnify:CR=1 FL=1
MKKIKVLLSLFLFTFFFSFISKPSVVNADMGPKPASYVTIKGIEGDRGLFIAMPSKRTADGEFRDIAHPINSETRESIPKIILDSYEKSLLVAEE